MTVPWDRAILDQGCYVDRLGRKYCDHVHASDIDDSIRKKDDGSYEGNEPPPGWTAQNPQYYGPEKLQDNEVRIIGPQ